MTDFFIGFLVGQFTAFKIGFWSLAVGIVTGLLWYAAGQGWLGTKLWRVLGVPFVVTFAFVFPACHWWYIASFAAQCAWSSVGWSVRDVNQAKASVIGTFWWRKFGFPSSGWPRIWVDLLSRGTWLAALALTMLPLLVK